MGRIDGKTALVTGAGAGIGRAVALRLAEEGARVAVSGRNETSGRAVVSEIREAAGEAIYVPLDVASEAAWQDAARSGPRLRPVRHGAAARSWPASEVSPGSMPRWIGAWWR